MTLPEKDWNDSVAYINTQTYKDFVRMDRRMRALEEIVDYLSDVLNKALAILAKNRVYMQKCKDLKARIDK